MKKLFSSILAITLIIPMLSIPSKAVNIDTNEAKGLVAYFSMAAVPTFSDVAANHWAYSFIEEAYKDGAVSGTYYNEQTGERRFSPDATLTMAQFITIQTSAFYKNEVAASTATGTWYARNEEVANKHNLFQGLGNVFLENPASRYQMAMVITNLLKDKGIEMPAPTELQAAGKRIADWNSMPDKYHDAVATVFALGIISGVDSNGTFAGDSTVTRAQAAVIYVRTRDVIGKGGTTTPTDPTTPTNPTNPTEPTDPTTPSNSGKVGTISDSEVTLSLETHKPIYDYWSEQPSDIQKIADKDRFNAAAQTVHDSWIIMNEGKFSGITNRYYNYAVVPSGDITTNTINVGQAMTLSADCYGVYGSEVKSGMVYYTIQPLANSAKLEPIFEPILARMTDNMSDTDKVKICVQEVVDRIDYEVNGGATWINGKTTGDCDDYRNMLSSLLSAAGIPNISISAKTSKGAHAWLQVFVDGEWMIVDGTSSEAGWGDMFTFSWHESHWGYNHSVNDGDKYKVARALMEIPH